MATSVESRHNILNINVGILGHVDSGKTSLVKALSTSLSTAALDKHPQSQERGITLDLGFSCFTLPLPQHLQERAGEDSLVDTLQFTLVDCPGHASLLRTIIGGAQIIDMIVLVIDANKGIQTQTAECIVIGEITTHSLVIALNKVDLIPEAERQEKIDKVSRRIRKALFGSKFADVKIVPVSAAVGGERVAAVGAGGAAGGSIDSLGIDNLVNQLKEMVRRPNRQLLLPFLFAIDHCFPIKGHGTVLTGTVLSGRVAVNQVIEIPHLQLTRKVKSMQIFHRAVESAGQGDRVALCLTNLDARLLERSLAAAPNTLPSFSAAIALVRKVRFFRMVCRSDSRCHISIGHHTSLAKVTFFGGKQLQNGPSRRKEGLQNDKERRKESECTSVQALHGYYHRLFPAIDYLPNEDFEYQDAILDAENSEGMKGGHDNEEMTNKHEGRGPEGEEEEGNGENGPVQWVLLQFQQSLHCPIGSLVIGSRLDTDTSDARGPGAHLCRLAFYGPIKAIVALPQNGNSGSVALPSGVTSLPLSSLGVFQWKEKRCEVLSLSDLRANGICYEAIAWKLCKDRASLQPFLGMRVRTAEGRRGVILAAYGAEGQFRVKFPRGARVEIGHSLIFRYKKYVFNKTRFIEQQEDSESEEEKVEIVEPLCAVEKREDALPNKFGEKHKRKSSQSVPLPPAAAAASAISLAPTPSPPPIVPTSGISTATAPQKEEEREEEEPAGERREGTIESIKPDPDLPSNVIAVVQGAFRMEENVKGFVGSAVRGPRGAKGTLVASFGKLGKCKVRLSGLDNPEAQAQVIGATITIFAAQKST
eukprot:gene3602-3945_t